MQMEMLKEKDHNENQNDSQPASEHHPKPEVTKFEDLYDDVLSCVCNHLSFRDVDALQNTSKTFHDSYAMEPHNEKKDLLRKIKENIEDGASSSSTSEASFSVRAQKLLKCCLGQRGQEEKEDEINGLDGPMTQKEWLILRSKQHEVFNYVKDGLNFEDATKLVLLENEIEELEEWRNQMRYSESEQREVINTFIQNELASMRQIHSKRISFRSVK